MSKNKLIQMLLPCASWKNEGDNQLAKETLKNFLVELKKLKPCKYYEIVRYSHSSYLRELIKAKIALDQNLYQRVCNELVTLLHSHCYNDKKSNIQHRIYYNIIGLLEDGL